MGDRPKRKAIPDKVKLEVVLQQDGKCPICKERLGDLKGLNFDHRPAIINREVNEAGTDYIPPQLDPGHLQAVHADCHKSRTFGPGGEKRITTAGSDTHIRDKTRDLAAKHSEFISRILAKSSGDNSDNPSNSKPKSKFGKRPFPPAQRKGRASNYRRKGV